MAGSSRLKTFLADQKIRATWQKHSPAYTAQEIAAAQHISGKRLAKCVLLKAGNGWALAVLPAAQRIDLNRLKTVLGAKSVGIAKESDIKRTFPDVEVGAMSPFGNLYGIPTVIERSLTESNELVGNAGTHTETLSVPMGDFLASVKPKVGVFGMAVTSGKSGGANKRRSKKPARRPAAKGKTARGRTTSSRARAALKPARRSSTRRSTTRRKTTKRR